MQTQVDHEQLLSQYSATQIKVSELSVELEQIKDEIVSSHELRRGAKVLCNGLEYYVFRLELFYFEVGTTSIYLTLTNLTKGGKLPGRPIKSTYVNYSKVTFLGEYKQDGE